MTNELDKVLTSFRDLPPDEACIDAFHEQLQHFRQHIYAINNTSEQVDDMLKQAVKDREKRTLGDSKARNERIQETLECMKLPDSDMGRWIATSHVDHGEGAVDTHVAIPSMCFLASAGLRARKDSAIAKPVQAAMC